MRHREEQDQVIGRGSLLVSLWKVLLDWLFHIGNANHLARSEECLVHAQQGLGDSPNTIREACKVEAL